MNRFRSSRRASTGLWLIAAAAALLLSPGAARADQFVQYALDAVFSG